MTFKNRYLTENKEQPKSSSPLKSAALAGLGGMLGAGLDAYLSGKVDVQDFIKPMASWGAGGALGGLGGIGDYFNKQKNTKKEKDIL